MDGTGNRTNGNGTAGPESHHLSEHDQRFSPEIEAAWEEEICLRMKPVTAGAARSRSVDEAFADLSPLAPWLSALGPLDPSSQLQTLCPSPLATAL